MLNLQFGVKQQQTLTPQLKQAIYLLQMPTQALQQYLDEALNSNPLLEAEDKNKSTVEIDEPYIPYAPSYRKSEPQVAWEANYCEGESLKDHLEWQLELSDFSDDEHEIALAIIDSIDEDGFLKTTELDIPEQELLPVLTRVQKFDPVGVAARGVTECLLLQLEQLPEDTPYKKAAETIIEFQLKKLALKDYVSLQKATNLNEENLHKAIALIQSLNPRPGSQYAAQDTQYVVPDVILSKTDTGWMVRSNESVLPKLSVNQEFAQAVQKDVKNKEMQGFKDQLQDAKLLIKSIHNRQETLLKVSQYIVREQEDFFNYGEQAMKPMILKDLASELGFHESTISRTTTGKYMLTPNGIYELKYFFSSHVGSDKGDLSATAIKASIKKLIAEEDVANPLSDSAVATKLTDQGVKIARRTVTKYREAMQIPSAKMRKTV